MATAKITKRPTAKVTSLTAPARVENTWGWRSTCKVPATAKDTKSNARATYMEEEWELGMGLGAKNPKLTSKPSINYTGAFTCWINAGYNWSNGFKNVTRQSFYPLTSRKLYNIHLRMRLCNDKGRGDAVHMYRALELPQKPTVSALTQNAETGVVTATIKVDHGVKNNKECYDCRYRISVLDTRVSKKTVVKTDTTSRAAEFTVRYDVGDRQQLSYDQYVKVTVEAWTRGLRGDSEHVSRSTVVCYPAQATIKGVDIPTTASTGKVTVRMATNSNANHYVTGVKLQKLVGVSYTAASQIPANAGWEDTTSVDNGTCTALAVGVSDVKPDAGLTSWVRIKSWNLSEDIFSRYSEPVRLTKLETPLPTAQDESIKLLSLISGGDGESAIATLAWNESGTDDATGTELSWSDNPDSWKSTEEPSDYQFTWSDGTITHGGVTYQDSAIIHIRGLSENTLYYVKARRYLEGDLGTTYSPYSDAMSVLPTTTPDSVTLIVPSFVERGKPLQLSWVYGSDSPQTAWEILNGDTVVANGTDAIGACIITAERLESLVDGDSVTLAVRMSTGGDFVVSDPQEVRIVDAPTLGVSIAETVTAQEPVISFTSDAGCSISYVITAQGIQSDYPDGTRTQVAGDTITSAVVNPEWTETEGVYTSTVTLPAGLPFWDDGQYTLRATATNPATGLTSAAVETEFKVVWAHQAPVPSENIAITPHDETDEDGLRSRYVDIQLAAPEGAETTDLYDIYRVTPDKAYLVAVDAGQTDLVQDPYAPYGATEMVYRIACRTADGDISWLDYAYELPGDALRIDFGSRYVELPYNIVIGDSYTKDFESRAHLGASTPQGYWNDTISRSSRLSTDVLRIKDQDKQAALRDLAAYSGPCFLRLPNGCAYQANVDVSGLDWQISNVAPVSLDATEVGLTEEYMAIVPIPETAPDETPEEM